MDCSSLLRPPPWLSCDTDMVLVACHAAAMSRVAHILAETWGAQAPRLSSRRMRMTKASEMAEAAGVHMGSPARSSLGVDFTCMSEIFTWSAEHVSLSALQVQCCLKHFILLHVTASYNWEWEFNETGDMQDDRNLMKLVIRKNDTLLTWLLSCV